MDKPKLSVIKGGIPDETIRVGDTITDRDHLVTGVVTGMGTITKRRWPVYLVRITSGHQAGEQSAIFQTDARLIERGTDND